MMYLWIALRSLQQRGLASWLTMVSMALGVMMITAVLTIHGVVSASFANNSALGYNLIVGPKGGSLQLTLNSVFYLSKPLEPVPYNYYLEFKSREERQKAYQNSVDRAAVEAQQAALELAQAQSPLVSVPGATIVAQLAGDEALQKISVKGLDQDRDGRFASFTEFAIPLCLGDYLDKFRVVGTSSEFFDRLKDLDPGRQKKLEFAEGRAFERFNEEHGWYEASIGATVAREMNLKVGDVIHPNHGSAEGHKHDQGFTIVGVLKPTGAPHDRAVFVNLEGFYLMDDHAKPLEAGEETEVESKPAEGTAKPVQPKRKWPEPLAIEQREVSSMLVRTDMLLGQSLSQAINEGSDAQAASPIGETFGLFNMIVNPIQQMLLVLTSMICVVSGVSILVGIYNSMSDRRRDIAVMRALGASRGTVSWIILSEALFLSLGGGLLGWVAGHTLNLIASTEIENRTGVTLGFFSFAPGPKLTELLAVWPKAWDTTVSTEFLLIPAMIALAVVFGLLPAIVAYRTDVSRALAP